MKQLTNQSDTEVIARVVDVVQIVTGEVVAKFISEDGAEIELDIDITQIVKAHVTHNREITEDDLRFLKSNLMGEVYFVKQGPDGLSWQILKKGYFIMHLVNRKIATRMEETSKPINARIIEVFKDGYSVYMRVYFVDSDIEDAYIDIRGDLLTICKYASVINDEYIENLNNKLEKRSVSVYKSNKGYLLAITLRELLYEE
ncbi:hypothetical protein D3C76_1134460 [compost metagenome]